MGMKKLSFFMGLLMLALFPVLSRQDGFDQWVALQESKTSVATSTLDAKLSTAEASRLGNGVDPYTIFGAEDGMYKSISECISNIPNDNTRRHMFNLKPGTVFREKVFVGKDKPFVTLKSDPSNPAVIVWNDTAMTKGKDGKLLTSRGSSTVTIESDYFIAYGIIIKNDALPAKAGDKQVQATALHVTGTKAIFYNCTIEGGQGALYDHQGLHYFKASTIKGSVDFIFGSARSLYEDCSIISTNKDITNMEVAQEGWASESRINSESGFSFKNCTIKGEGKPVFLGRASGNFSQVVYSSTEMDSEIVPIIWEKGNMKIPKSGIYYGEFKCYGPGLDASKKAGWALSLTEAQAKPFTCKSFISGGSWITPLPPADP
ncbi:hypothetical protein CFC21_032378 [Triticum aestivum]|uniref:Pectinesterase n=2 Tax=Triticum aestivum TaxID=4565 RepID=A0A9R1EZH8_WHEAT|nr:putative pectinesterase 63 [Triticum aestivum]KAF7019174.1 hypothetical protein CFC21_032378 [Triticum aestivum]